MELRASLLALGTFTSCLLAQETGAASRPGSRPGSRGGAGRGARRVATAAERARPPLMPWQRDLDDALELVKRTGKPLLIAVNMDGEPASEVFAWQRYRDPEFAKLASGFVCVLASPDRRNPRDHDDRGWRIAEPRFGRVVDAEHIEIEPTLYARYFHEQRVAPRHVGVAPDGKVLFDLFLLQDLSA